MIKEWSYEIIMTLVVLWSFSLDEIATIVSIIASIIVATIRLLEYFKKKKKKK